MAVQHVVAPFLQTISRKYRLCVGERVVYYTPVWGTKNGRHRRLKKNMLNKRHPNTVDEMKNAAVYAANLTITLPPKPAAVAAALRTRLNRFWGHIYGKQ